MRDPQVIACYDHVKATSGRLSVHPHPIDKAEFSRLYNAFPIPPKVRMLVYHRGTRKNSAELIATLRDLGLQENSDFSIVPHVPKERVDLLSFLRQNFLVVANTSYSETGPINMIEYLISGHAIYGHDDWWDGAGDGRFCWSYDPALMERNRAGILGIFRDMGPAGVAAERDRVWHLFMERTDNNWDAVTGPVCEHVASLLDSDHPGRPR